MAVLLFSYVWPVLPASHMHSVDADLLSPAGRLLDLARHLLLPALVTGLATAGGTARFLRASLIEVMSQDYIRAARAKGLSERAGGLGARPAQRRRAADPGLRAYAARCCSPAR